MVVQPQKHAAHRSLGARLRAAEVMRWHGRLLVWALYDYERRSAPVLLAVSVAYVALALVEILPGIPLPEWLIFLNGALWIILLVDYVWRLVFLADDPRRYWRTPLCLLDLVVLASFPVLLVLSSGFLGLALIPRIIREVLLITSGRARHWATRSALRWLVPFALVVIVLSAAYVWRAESYHADSGIQSFWDALWWTIATMLKVDYGDTYPHTMGGQIAAITLMVLGFAAFGWFTAALASVFVENDDAAVDEKMHLKLDVIAMQLASLEAHLTGGEGAVTDAAEEQEWTSGRATHGFLDDWERLAALHKDGQLTEEEFDGLKATLLDQQRPHSGGA